MAETVTQLGRLAPLLDDDKDTLDIALQRAPANYRKVVRLGAYGSFINYYLCGVTFRATDLQGRTTILPWIKQTSGRCAEPVMLKYLETNLIRHGIIGCHPGGTGDRSRTPAGTHLVVGDILPYSAVFAEAGGLSAGDRVMVSGVQTGSVSSVGIGQG